MESKYTKAMLDTAYVWSKLSSCKRKQVGCVLAMDSRVLATGYNGTVSGQDNNCEITCDSCNGIGFDSVLQEGCDKCKGCGFVTNPLTVHAEQNVIAFCSKYGIATKGTTLYITLSPCKECSKLIAQAGIAKVIYSSEYRDTSGIAFLISVGVEVSKVNT